MYRVFSPSVNYIPNWFFLETQKPLDQRIEITELEISVEMDWNNFLSFLAIVALCINPVENATVKYDTTQGNCDKHFFMSIVLFYFFLTKKSICVN